ncbi:MAG: class I SAM-dependent methyltransferase, partial [Chlamydiales bacterium]|nr:class I SAM-dependent methyltransferase [Chlamydiales bacterium]
MQIETRITLKAGKDRPIRQRHHWIFSGAVQDLSSCKEGDAAEVYTADGEKLGIALLNKGGSILGQMIAFGSESLEEALRRRIKEAFSLRRNLFNLSTTNAFRLINMEGDGIPGLIVDVYNNVFVLQISTMGIEKRKEFILSLLVQEGNPTSIFEKSTSALRQREGLLQEKGHLYGGTASQIEVLENGLRFFVDVLEGQKTGLFLDQREMREQIKHLSFNKKVLN